MAYLHLNRMPLVIVFEDRNTIEHISNHFLKDQLTCHNVEHRMNLNIEDLNYELRYHFAYKKIFA